MIPDRSSKEGPATREYRPQADRLKYTNSLSNRNNSNNCRSVTNISTQDVLRTFREAGDEDGQNVRACLLPKLDSVPT